MKLNSALIYYWFRHFYPSAELCNPDISESLFVGRPMFASGLVKACEHIVVITPDTCEHFVHHQGALLPVLIGCRPDFAQRYQKECIILEEEVPLSDVFNVLQNIFDRYQEWMMEAEKATTTSFSFDAIVQSCDPFLDVPLALSDTQFRYVSYSRKLAVENNYEEKYVGDGGFLPLEYITQLTATPDFKQLENEKDVFQFLCVENMLHKNVFFKDEFVGRLSLPYSAEEYKNRYYRQMLKLIIVYIERLYDNMGSFWHRKIPNTKLELMLRDLLEGRDIKMEVLKQILISQGCQRNDSFYLIQLKSHFSNPESKMTMALTTHLEKIWPGTCCVPYQNRLIVFINISKYRRCRDEFFNQELAVFLRDSLLLAGISRSFTDMTMIRAAYEQTDIALDIGEQLDPTYWYFKYDDYAFFDLLHHGCRDFYPEQICDPAINILRKYDLDNHTELNLTLKTYIEKQYNAVATASELCIARSTFLKRYERIEKLTGIDLNDFQRRIYLALSYELFHQQHKKSEK